MGAALARTGTAGLSSLPLLKVTTALTYQFLHLDHWLSLFHAFPSDVAVTGKEISLFRNLAAASWTTSKPQSAYSPISC